MKLKINNEKKIFGIALTIFLVTLISLSSVNAFILDQHVGQSKSALDQTPSSSITSQIEPYRDYFIACNLGTDISVVSYLQIEEDESDNFFDKLFKIFTFNIGKSYRATHSANACQRAISVAQTDKELACGYGICSHLMQDTVSHNKGVPLAIEKTNLFNGLVHSIKEIHDKDLFATPQDTLESRQNLDLLYEMTPYFEKVFVQDPAFSDVSIPNLIDFFVKQVQPNSEYQLGFRSFFALPTYIYWMLLVIFLIAVALLGLTTRKLIDKEFDTLTIFSFTFALLLFGLTGTTIYGLFAGNIWRMWEVVSQFIFSPAMYPIGALLILSSIFIVYRFSTSQDKLNKIPNLLVAIFLLIIGIILMTLPTGLDTGNEMALHSLAIDNTIRLLNNGINEVKFIEDPVGYVALKEADAHGQGTRTTIMVSLILLLISILFFTFRKRKK